MAKAKSLKPKQTLKVRKPSIKAPEDALKAGLEAATGLTGAGSLTFDSEFRLIHANRPVARALGLSRTDLEVGKPLEKQPGIKHVKGIDDLKRKIRERVFDKGKRLVHRVDMKTPDGRRQQWRMAVSPVVEEGNVIGAVASFPQRQNYEIKKEGFMADLANLSQTIRRKAGRYNITPEKALWRAAAKTAMTMPGVDAVRVSLYTPPRRRSRRVRERRVHKEPTLRTVAVQGGLKRTLKYIGHSEGVIGRAAATRKPQLAEDLSQDHGYAGSSFEKGFKSAAAIPFEGGVITVYSKYSRAFENRHVELGSRLASDVGARLKDVRESERNKYINRMTGLWNGDYFNVKMKELQKGVRKTRPVSTIYADLRGLKTANDLVGHDAGDALIKKTAEVLKGAGLRAPDVVSRLSTGGDEFGFLLHDTTREEAGNYLRRITEKIEKWNSKKTSAKMRALGLNRNTKFMADFKEAVEKAKIDPEKFSDWDRKYKTLLALHGRTSRVPQQELNEMEEAKSQLAKIAADPHLRILFSINIDLVSGVHSTSASPNKKLAALHESAKKDVERQKRSYYKGIDFSRRI